MSVSMTTGRGGTVATADDATGRAVGRAVGLMLAVELVRDTDPQATSSRLTKIQQSWENRFARSVWPRI
jgi:hypothetical protein